MTTSQIASQVAHLPTAEERYRALIDYNGRIQNMALRRMSREQLVALIGYADTRPNDPHSGTNGIAWGARRELAKR